MTTTTSSLSPLGRFFVMTGATVGGAGLSPIAPGTVGTLVALPAFWLMARFQLWIYLLVLVALIVLAIWVSDLAERVFGGHDDGHIVADEFVGLLTTTIAVPFNWKTALIAFVLFRILDIKKPFGIRWLDDHIEGGLGVVVDDVAAGLVGCLVLQVALYFFPAQLL
jgi:phosphatidylglycerophosphatase A